MDNERSFKAPIGRLSGGLNERSNDLLRWKQGTMKQAIINTLVILVYSLILMGVYFGLLSLFD